MSNLGNSKIFILKNSKNLPNFIVSENRQFLNLENYRNSIKGKMEFNIGRQYWKTGRQLQQVLEYWKLVYSNIILEYWKSNGIDGTASEDE